MAFGAVRDYQEFAARPILGWAYLAIIIQARALQLSSPDPERDLLDFLSKPPTGPDLARARKEVLEHTRTCGGAGVGSAPKWVHTRRGLACASPDLNHLGRAF